MKTRGKLSGSLSRLPRQSSPSAEKALSWSLSATDPKAETGDSMGGGIRSNVKSFLLKHVNFGAADSNLSGPEDAHSAEKNPFSPCGPSRSVTDGTPLSCPHYDKFQSPSLGAKDFMDMSRWMMANNDKQTSEGLLKKRKFETSELEELSEKIEYINGFAPAYRYQTPTDILLHAGDHGPSIPAHKLLLATRSKILNHIPNSYVSKAPSNQVNTISLPELNHEELESLLDFLYNADLPEEKMNKHVYSLYVAANKYGIPYLDKFCVRHMLKSLSSANALDVLEVANAHSCQPLKDNVMNYIAENASDIVFSARFEALSLKNPNLCVQISRASLKDSNKKSVISVKKNINSSGPREAFMKQNPAIRRRDK